MSSNPGNQDERNESPITPMENNDGLADLEDIGMMLSESLGSGFICLIAGIEEEAGAKGFQIRMKPSEEEENGDSRDGMSLDMIESEETEPKNFSF